MGNALCCASPEDAIEAVVDDKKPRLFGKLNVSESEDSDNHPIEERLRDLIPKIRNVKKQLESCLRQQVRLKEEVSVQMDGDTVSLDKQVWTLSKLVVIMTNWCVFRMQKVILEAIIILKRRSDQCQVKMTQECEQILNEAEKIQKEKLKSHVSANKLSYDADEADE